MNVHAALDALPIPHAPSHGRAHPLLAGVTVGELFGTHAAAAMFPLSAGVALYGWRAVASVAIVLGAAAGATFIWRRIGMRGAQLRYPHVLWLALLLALTLPAHVASTSLPDRLTSPPAWPILASAGVGIAVLVWGLGGIGASRTHPVVVVHLLAVALFHGMLVPHFVLHRNRAAVGDVLNAGDARIATIREPWIHARLPAEEHDAAWREVASQRLIFFTTGNASPDRTWLTLDQLIRDQLPPLEDLIVGGQPAAIGAGSAVAVIIGGLFLIYRGLIDFRIPLLTVATAYAALLVLPVPVVITEHAPQWQWFIARQGAVGWSWALTFAHYELFAGPLLFVGFFLATAHGLRPATRRGRAVFAVLLGIAAAICQLYVSVSFGAYLALLVVAPLTPLLNRGFRPKPIV